MAPKVTEDVRISYDEGECQDGCGGKPTGKGSRFIVGHDAKLHSLLIAAFRGGVKVITNGKSQSAAQALADRNWPEPAPLKAKKPMSDETKAKLRESKGGGTTAAKKTGAKVHPAKRASAAASA